MTKRHYESVVIINAALEDDQIDTTLSRIEETLSAQGAELTDLEKLGRKRLAYPIQKSKSGYYAVYRFIAPSGAITELERVYRLDENIVRYLTITLGKKDLAYIEKMKERATEVTENTEVENSNENGSEEDKQSSD